MPGNHTQGEHLWTALLAYTLGLVLVVTLAPFRFVVPDTFEISGVEQPFDLVANVALFIPLGFLYRLARPDLTGRGGLRVLGLGLLVSSAIECGQIFQPERFPSLLDVVANTLGGWAGAAVHTRLGPAVRAHGERKVLLSLAIPLLGILYLLVPLLWIDTLATGDLAFRLWLPLWLGLFGAILLGEVQRYHFGPKGIFSPRKMAVIGAGGFLIGAAPGLKRWTVQLGAFAAVAALLTWYRGRTPLKPGAERRFEIPALRTAAPFYGLYLLFLGLAQLTGRAGSWHAHLGFPASMSALSNLELLRLVESVAAFTLLGFMVAEFRGRRELPFGASLPHIVLWAGLAGAIVELLRGFRPGYGASALQLVLSLGAASYGGWLYHLQRDHARQQTARAHQARCPVRAGSRS